MAGITMNVLEVVPNKESIAIYAAPVGETLIQEYRDSIDNYWFYRDVSTIYAWPLAPLIKLTGIFLNRLFNEYYYLDEEDRVLLVKDTFESFGLKQYMEYVESRIVISTIHGAKGLEWDYVIMPDMEQYSLPSWFGACQDCEFKKSCIVAYAEDNEKKYLDELSVFYVGFTRAKSQVFFSASKKGLTFKGEEQDRNLSCFLLLKGVRFNSAS